MSEVVSFTIMGLVATGVLTTFLWLVSGISRIDADMVKAIGALYTNSLVNAMGPGILMHFTGGLLCAYLYGIFFGLLDFEAHYSYALMGMAIGLGHGIIVASVLKLLLAEHHPIHRYAAVDRSIFIIHVAGHVIYGLVLGTMFASFMI